MGQSVVDSSEVNSLREPLLLVNNDTMLDNDDIDNNSLIIDGPDAPENNGKAESDRVTTKSSEQNDLVDTRILEHMGSPLTYYVIGQWIWLYLAWSNMRDVVYGYKNLFHVVVSIMAWSFVMVGHCFFLTKLSLLVVPAGGGGRKKESRGRTAKVNQETLPAALSGLRVFCLDSGERADKFLVVIVLSFLLFELCRGSSGCATLSVKLTRKKHIYDEIMVVDDEHAMDHLEAQKGESQDDAFDNEKKDERDSSIAKLMERRDWGVIGQWIWLFVVWFIIRYFIEFGTIGASYDDACIFSWLIVMLGHGIFRALRISKSHERPSLFCVNRENLPMMLSTFFLFSFDDTADQFLVIIATWFTLPQIVRAVWRFSLNLLFTTFSKMEKEYFERLKEQEPEEAAKLEAQMQRMAYLETLPRPDPTIRTRKQLLSVLGPIVFCFCLIALNPPDFTVTL